jgi:hypothetical protein
MALIRLSSFNATAESGFPHSELVCPQRVGRMGGRGKEFECQGKCQTDWRQVCGSHSPVRLLPA